VSLIVLRDFITKPPMFAPTSRALMPISGMIFSSLLGSMKSDGFNNCTDSPRH
jgi:hypothetical protein